MTTASEFVLYLLYQSCIVNIQSALTIVVPVNNHVFICANQTLQELFVRMVCLFVCLFLAVFAEPLSPLTLCPVTHGFTVESDFTGLEISIFSKNASINRNK